MLYVHVHVHTYINMYIYGCIHIIVVMSMFREYCVLEYVCVKFVF